ncbi:non-canonical purine NTP pyrophosphatase [Saccharicrinis sp. FJH2]|uniref:non-canonical purine NTP pyrophosphatase n=1 Tax=Saccharicrinis sp. FJH65 TaxID=3344659 RepID=UPI0035F324FA
MKNSNLFSFISSKSLINNHLREINFQENQETAWNSHSVFICDSSSKIKSSSIEIIKELIKDGAIFIYFHFEQRKISKNIAEITNISVEAFNDCNINITPTKNHSTILNEVYKEAQCSYAYPIITQNDSIPLLNYINKPVGILKQVGLGQILAYFVSLDYIYYQQLINNITTYTDLYYSNYNFKEINLGTSNKLMANELKPFMDQLNISIKNISLDSDKIETFNSYAENALAKARVYYNEYKIPVLTQDSGVSIDYLDGKPAVNSKETVVDEEFLLKLKDAANRDAHIDQLQLLYWRYEFDNGSSKEMYLFQYSKIPVKIAHYIKGHSSHKFDNILLTENNKFLSELSLSDKTKILNRDLGIKSIIQFIDSHNHNFFYNNQTNNSDIFLCGDFNYDQYIYNVNNTSENVGRHFERYVTNKTRTNIICRFGGIFLLEKLIRFYSDDKNNIHQPIKLENVKIQTEKYLERTERVYLGQRYNHQIFNISEHLKLPSNESVVYRIKNLITSYEVIVDVPNIEKQLTDIYKNESNLVISEFGLDNLRDPYQLLIELNKNKNIENLFIKTNRPLKFLEALSSTTDNKLKYCKNVFMACNSDNIFYPTPSRITFRSWEQLIEKIISEISNINFEIENTTKFWIFVLCRNEGCLLVKPQDGHFKIIAYLDSNYKYSELSNPNFGWVSEYQGVFFAKLIASISTQTNKDIDIDKLTRECWKQSRSLFINGFNQITKDTEYNLIETLNYIKKTSDSDWYINGFSPLYLSYNNNLEEGKGFTYNSKINKQLEFFENSLSGINDNQIIELCFQIISKGLTVLDRGINIEGRVIRLYMLKIRKLVSFRRKDVEKLTYLSKLIQDYSYRNEVFRPLSIAVFGQPGSGKSFIIKEIIKSFDIEFKFIECNLTQINSIDDLSTIFHQIQHASLDNKLPVVFWDEFDTSNKENLGWLKYFLAPMQDGYIKIKEKSYFFKRSIFVFAGGTTYTFSDFEKTALNNEFKKQKVPDFISRIKASYDVEGINYSEEDSNNMNNYSKIIKRSLLIRHLLKQHIPHLRTISKELLIKLLLFNYKSGIRSLESIIESSTFSEDSHLSLNNLPDQEQLKNYIIDSTEIFDFKKENKDFLQF